MLFSLTLSTLGTFDFGLLIITEAAFGVNFEFFPLESGLLTTGADVLDVLDVLDVCLKFGK